MQTIVIGHKNPDMDSVVSAIAYARLKSRQGMENVEPARAGDTNPRIDFVLKKFGVPRPTLLTDVSPRVEDVMERDILAVPADAPAHEAIGIITAQHLRGLPVVDENQHCLGLLSAFKIHGHLFPRRETIANARRVKASLADLATAFGGEILTGTLGDEVQDYLLMIGAMSAETFAQRLKHYPAERIVLFTGDRDEIQSQAIQSGVSAVVITGGLPVTDAVIAEAAQADVPLVRSKYDSASTVFMARGAVRVTEMLETSFDHFSPDTPLETARHEATEAPGFLFPVLDTNQSLCGILSKSDFLKPVNRQLILVDHNELHQAVDGAEKIPIVEVIDHHRLGGFSSNAPILFWNNPVGSTSTLVALAYQQAGLDPDPPVAGLLMAGLIADTLNLTSPTATPVDREVMSKLEKTAGIRAADLAQAIFAAGSPLNELSPEKVIMADCKEYREHRELLTVAQIEELGFETFHRKKEALSEALRAERTRRGACFAGCLVTDINTRNSLLLADGETEILDRLPFTRLEPALWDLPGVVSRKKQLLPTILEILAKVQNRPRNNKP